MLVMYESWKKPKKNKLMVLERKMLRNIFGPKKKEMVRVESKQIVN